MVLLGLLGAFHIYMRHTSGERHLSSSSDMQLLKSVKMMMMMMMM